MQQAETYAGLRRQRWQQRLRRALFALAFAGGGALTLWLIQQIQL